ncbi:hypothetical protein H5123_17280 [Shewanella sp. SR43-4]|nr:hypothetical protein [Shewanella sp. SR43-4]
MQQIQLAERTGISVPNVDRKT